MSDEKKESGELAVAVTLDRCKDLSAVSVTVAGQKLTLRGDAFVGAAIPAGDHTLELTCKGYVPQSVPVKVGAGRANKVEVSLPKQPIVKLAKASKSYVDGEGVTFQAIRDVDIVIEDLPAVGEFLSILGPSGCGKSTVLSLIAGLTEATTGEVLVNGEPVRGPGPDRGMVFQNYSSMPWLTVSQNVEYGMKVQGTPAAQRRERRNQLLERVGLSGHGKKYPKELSGGMRQRVAIARTLAVSPQIILMDEPFGALDINTRMDMQDLLLNIWHQEEATILFVTHDISEAVYLADRVSVFTPSPGRIADEIPIKLDYPREQKVKSSSLFRRYEGQLIERIHELSASVAKGAEVKLSI
ncbi:MAG: sulfonate ABC transporter ATP-binding protein [Deltaproteobacteria bacterium CG_4_9_14_3_um_filter_63_12]|nr:MAG: sulfonate ABC transporter ATP-binding protein [Deltaproteobacteria bacterium CG17_big_fil_post_rev_8_21_14_2_50_63_7]PJB46893.1 MAG: sulfonate ABC transporter ATP-binding protein [Deltaproteobacteria bacterium CG_4_9_14_3_um_filter_63_12]